MEKLVLEEEKKTIPIGYFDICSLAYRGCKGALNGDIFYNFCSQKEQRKCFHHHNEEPIEDIDSVTNDPSSVNIEGRTFWLFVNKN